MDSVVSFQDLNLQLGTSGSAAATIVPKIEPKLEPFDEFALTGVNASPLFSNPSPTGNSESGSGFGLPAPTQPPGAKRSSEEANVYSEFNRISEMFRATFAEKMQGFGDVEAGEGPGSRAIVPVNDEAQLSNSVISKSIRQRSSELVRVTDLKLEDQRYFRDIVRKARMVYDSIRVLLVLEDEKNPEFGHFRNRADLKAAQLMRMRGLWLNRDKRIVGAIPGLFIGDVFFYRMELCVVGLHGQAQAGIDYLPANHSSNGEPIATSVIVSGGYEDDEDTGDVIIYTGHGGQNKFSRQCVNQKLESGNLAMERSMTYGIEVRVIRGFKYEGSASGKIYVYDGLYRIVDYWCDVGKSGFGVFKYKLVRIENQPEMGSSVLRLAQNLRTQPLVARPSGYISLDMSRNKESVPVFLYNDIDTDQEPAYYDYLVKTIFPSHVQQHAGNGTGCLCVDGCGANCFCAMRNGGEFAYDHNGILLRGKPLVFECGPHCRCPPTCRNRVSQRGVRYKFEVFRSRETGWGVRSLDLIQAGSFICEYSGVVLTMEQAQIFKMNGDSLVYPSRFAQRWAEWGDVSQIYPNYVHPTYPSVPPLGFAMDVSKMRNVACYMSHSSSPNIFVQLVLYDHNNVCFPRLMLFAMENIPPLRELSIDYGVADEWTGKLAICN
ncbi:PREDICTED: histone-lysine N-methyltransferase family member SUVH9-like [Ipomoea nil]|uniref:histone-lysine N-methyltransferase family member SUVH9-like n=1 Tax=Ipomoea nil TaxID=35883 RepID=UPI000901A448|nr:PREDICTED: histone-lysine N-methyltransferase family member SUVH9-like [Ipomoea nil]